MLHSLTTWRHRRNLQPNFSPVMCIRGVHLSNPCLFNFAMSSVKLAFQLDWINPRARGVVIPADISQSLTCKAGEAFALLATAEIGCVILLYLSGCTSVGREKLQLHNKTRLRYQVAFVTGREWGWFGICAVNDRQSFPGKGLHASCWEIFLVGSSSKQAHSIGLCQ